MDLRVTIGKTTFKNPVWTASGTFGYAEEFKGLTDLDKIGAIITKTVTLKKRKGNVPPRIVESSSGLINSIGLENKGIDHFIKEIWPCLGKIKTAIIVSVAGEGEKELVKCVEKLEAASGASAIELNLSCPNIIHKTKKGGHISQDEIATSRAVSAVRRKTKRCLIAKLSPLVTNIGAIAKAAREAGSDAVALVNTFGAMAINAEEMKPVLGSVTGGLSGPAIKPMALKAVWDVHNAVKIPIIGIGGIMTGLDAAEFMLAGASAVQVGTANFIDPNAPNRILEEFKAYLVRKKIKKARVLTGKLKKK